ncbi:hypothetical protein [Kordia sp.]|uniref:hypothetical protein n=1 Tax=Kordia sp. TaxID=1965332 RepID=UPI003D2DF1B6
MLLFTFSNYAQEKKCADFKTGEFRYVDKNMFDKIIRTDSLQTETNPDDNTIVKTTLEWTSECKYVMTYSEILNYKKDVSGIIGKKIYCEILEINGNRIKVHVKSTTVDEILEFIKIQ